MYTISNPLNMEEWGGENFWENHDEDFEMLFVHRSITVELLDALKTARIQVKLFGKLFGRDTDDVHNAVMKVIDTAITNAEK